jgi:hypothetical protein
MGKRKFDAVIDSRPVKVSEVAAKFLAEVSNWRDACGSEYDVRMKYETKDESSHIRIGTFDELSCTRVVAAADTELPGDYVTCDAGCDMTKKTMLFQVKRQHGAQNKHTTLEKSSHDTKSEDVASDFIKMRVNTMLTNKEDGNAVVEAMSGILKFISRQSVWTIVTGPAFYTINFKIAEPRIGVGAVRSASGYPGSVVDFENSYLRLRIPKCHPEIQA